MSLFFSGMALGAVLGAAAMFFDIMRRLAPHTRADRQERQEFFDKIYGPKP